MSKDSTFMDKIKPFLFGAISGSTATSVIQPIDTVKVRIQALGEQMKGKGKISPFTVAKEVIKNDGVKGLYKGFDAAILRQLFYGTTRFGLFQTIQNNIQEKKGRSMNAIEKVLGSLTAGFIGSLVGNPADLALIRFQVDSMLPVDQRRNYKNVKDAFVQIVQEGGVLSLWRGSSPTVVRAMTMNLGMLSTYESCKDFVVYTTGYAPKQLPCMAMASFISGIFASVLSLPADNVKTKLMKMKKKPDGEFPYRGFTDCMIKSIQNEGVLGLWVGIGTYITRIGPHVVVSLIIMDSLNTKFGKQH